MYIPLLAYSNNLSILKTKTMKQPFTTPRTHVLSLVSYAHNLTFLSSKFSRTLFLILFSVLFSQISFAQAPSIYPATANDDMPVPGYFFSAGHIETSICKCTSSSSGHLIAFVTDGDGTVYSSFTPERKAGLTVTDDNGHFDFYAFDGASYSTSPPPTSFRNPDVVLLENGKKAIITFETDDATNISYILELEINFISPTSIQIVQQSGQLNSPIKYLTAATSPRIDGDYDADRFAVVSIQINAPTYSIYEANAGSYAVISATNNISANANLIANTAMLPDISLGHFTGGGTPYPPECVVSYVDGDPTGFATANLIVDYQNNTPASSNQLTTTLASSSTTLFTSYDLYPNYPHICSEEEYNSGGSMQWALTESLIDPPNVGSLPNHILYVHSDYHYVPNLSALFYLDVYNPTYSDLQGKGTLDWMAQDGFVAWRNEVASPNTQQIVGVMNPLSLAPTITSWDQVYDNYNVASVTGTDWLQAVSVGRSDAITNLYVVAELFIGKIIYKVRGIGSTGFKPNSISATNNNIYPIPCTNILNIICNEDDQISVTDILGRVIFIINLQKGQNSINTSTLLAGNYFLLSKHNSNLNTLFSVMH